VATTFVAGVEAIRKGLAEPIGSLTQMGTFSRREADDGTSPKINEFVLWLGGMIWSSRMGHLRDDMYTAASKAGVLDQRCSTRSNRSLEDQASEAVFDRNYVKMLDGPT